MKNRWLLAIAVAAALLIRIPGLTARPLYGDELTIGLDANAILHNGTDERGNFLPFNFPMRGGSPPGYIYFSIPFVILFGQSVLAVRFLSLLSGVGMVVVVFLLVDYLVNRKTAFLASFMWCFNFWDVNLSRVGFETHLALFLTAWAVLFFLRKTRNWYLILSALLFFSSINTYPAYKLTVPLVVLSLLVWKFKAYWREVKARSYMVYFLIIIACSFLLLSYNALFSNAEGRFVTNSVFSRGLSLSQTAKAIAKNYWFNLSPGFLFLKGDQNPRHNQGGWGGFNLMEAGLIIIGWYVLKKKDGQKASILFFWTAIAVVPAALMDGGHFLRSSFLVLPLVIFSSVGLAKLLERKTLFCGWLVGYLFLAALFFKDLYISSYRANFDFWSYGAKSATDWANRSKDRFQFIFLSASIDNIEYAYPFYSGLPAQDVILTNQLRYRLKGRSFKKFGNVLIGDWDEDYLLSLQIPNLIGLKNYTGAEDCVETLRHPDGRPVLCAHSFR